MKWLLFLLIFLFFPIISSLDTQTIVTCSGDDELIIGCLGDEEYFFIGKVPVTLEGKTGAGFKQILLNYFLLEYDKEWHMNNNYYIYLKIYDINNKSYDNENIDIILISNLTNIKFDDEPVKRIKTGLFYKKFFIDKIDADMLFSPNFLDFNISVRENEKILFQNISIEIREYSFFQKLVNTIQNSTKLTSFTIYSLFAENWVMSMFVFLIFPSVLILAFFVKYMIRKNREERK